MYLAFIHIGRYDIKARRHLACVQNGITQLGDWRMETWQLALRARCHVSIRQSPSLCNAILNTCPCLLAIKIIWVYFFVQSMPAFCDTNRFNQQIDGILLKGPYPPCLRMADRALLAGYQRNQTSSETAENLGDGFILFSQTRYRCDLQICSQACRLDHRRAKIAGLIMNRVRGLDCMST